MYQLFAYGKKYAKEMDHEPFLVLLYPLQESFNHPLTEFHYDQTLKLKAIPVNLDCTLEKTIELINDEITKFYDVIV